MDRFADLHLHTFFSDGTYSPEELVDKAATAGLSAISVVDHDTVAGIAPSIQAARTRDVEIIPGIELTAAFEGVEVHILGYLLDFRHRPLLEALEHLKQNRIERVHRMVEKLGEMGVQLDPEGVFAQVGEGSTVSRLHVARALVAKGIVGSTGEAFQKYIGDSKPGYVLGFKLSPAEAVGLIREAGGVAVLAHPYTLHHDERIPSLVEQGIRGLEVYYPEHSPDMISKYEALADRYGLLRTGGSDCHGTAKPDVRVGSIKIPYELVQALKEAAR